MAERGLHILLISVHGLIRATNPELGRDPDTGGQVLYVLELAKALARQPEVAQVDLLTRLVEDPSVSSDYANPEEPIAPKARILRLPFGPPRYLRKELLWDHLDGLVNAYLAHVRGDSRLPDLIHSHYGDAGYVAHQLSSLLDLPFIHSGHSLGRVKRASLLRAGGKDAQLERMFHFSKRIPVEEDVLANASIVITSTKQELVHQYGLYERFEPRRAHVIPPGTDLSRFSPPDRRSPLPAIAKQVDRFLKEPRKPMLLCIGRPAPRKNLLGLVQAFGEHPSLRQKANLVLVAGNREDVASLDDTSRSTWEELLRAVDRYDLYGHIAIPKSHRAEDIPELYRLAVLRRGLCVNPSHSETFGLTLIEAAATGLPLVATASGGPVDILANCRNGLLADASDPAELASAMEEALANPKRWGGWSRNGGVREGYTWDAHVRKYLKLATRLLWQNRKRFRKAQAMGKPRASAQFLTAEWLVILDLDRTLIGEREGLEHLKAWLRDHRSRIALGVITGRKFESALWVLRDWGVDLPDVLITSVGTEIHYGPAWELDAGWDGHIRRDWRRSEVARVMESIPGMRPQAQRKLGPCKLSYFVSPRHFPGLQVVHDHLHRSKLKAQAILSQSRYLDFLPHRASKGQAVRYLAFKWGFPHHRIVVAGDSGNDLDMLTGVHAAIVVGNHSPELAMLKGREEIYFAERGFAGGVLEGLKHFQVLDETADPLPAGSAPMVRAALPDFHEDSVNPVCAGC